MKYAIIIPDGAADEPLPQLEGRTPLEAASLPNMDRIAAEGHTGLVRTIPDGFESGSDVATMCLLGYAPARYHSGRAPLEAAAQRISLSSTDWVFRCNLVTVTDGIMKDHSAGGITNAEALRLVKDLTAAIAKEFPEYELHPGVSYRNLLVYRGRQAFELTTTPPHEIPELPASQHLPKGKGSEVLRGIMDISARLYADHPVNIERRKKGLRTADQVWFWGQGHAPAMESFAQRFHVSPGAAISSVDLVRGLAVLLGWDIINVPGMTSYHDTNYRGQGEATAAALDKYNLVFSHIEAPDEASHQADHKTKVASVEAIDRYVVGPVLEKLRQFPEWRILIIPDHQTLVSNRKHGYGPTVFAMAGTGVKSINRGKYCEKTAKSAGVFIERGEELMEYFLRRGA